MEKSEVWAVEIKDREWQNEKYEWHVIATTAGMAEHKGLALAKKEKMEWPYCSRVSFEFYIDA